MKKPALSGTTNAHALKQEMRRMARYALLDNPYFAPFMRNGRKQRRKPRNK